MILLLVSIENYTSTNGAHTGTVPILRVHSTLRQSAAEPRNSADAVPLLLFWQLAMRTKYKGGYATNQHILLTTLDCRKCTANCVKKSLLLLPECI